MVYSHSICALSRSPYVSHSHVVYNADRAGTAHGQLGADMLSRRSPVYDPYIPMYVYRYLRPYRVRVLPAVLESQQNPNLKIHFA